MKFTKMHGCGNDYVYVNCFDETVADPAAAARFLSDRHCGVGSDGLILILPSAVADLRMRMFNADGSEAQMCGNGIRCLAKYAFDHGLTGKTDLKVETGAGIRHLVLTVSRGKVEKVRVNMGEPESIADCRILTQMNADKNSTLISTDCTDISSISVNQCQKLLHLRPSASILPAAASAKAGCVQNPKYKIQNPKSIVVFEVSCVSMGNPHAVIRVDDVASYPVGEHGPLIENHPAFPGRTNVQFAEVISRNELRLRTWERGSGETLSCGTGASAAVVACSRKDWTDRSVVVHVRGGDLEVEWAEDGSVYLTGPAVEVFTGEWPT